MATGNNKSNASTGRSDKSSAQTAGTRSSASRNATGTRGSSTKQKAYLGNARDNAQARKNKANSAKSGTTRTRSTSGNGTRASAKTNPQEYEQLKLRFEEDNNLRDEITIILVLLAGVLLVLSYLHLCGSFGEVLNKITFGLMGGFGYAFPFVMVFIAVFAIANKRNRSIVAKTIYFVCMMLFISALVQLGMGGFRPELKLGAYFTNSVPGYLGADKTYGGFFGGLICKLLCPYMGNVGAAVIMVAAIIIFFLLIVGKALFTALAKNGVASARERRQRRLEEEEQLRIYEEEHEEELEREQGRDRRRERAGEREASGRRDTNDASETLEDEFDDEFFEKEQKRKEKQNKPGLVDKLMRMGMGLDVDRIADTPEYQKLKDKSGIKGGEAEDGDTDTEIKSGTPAYSGRQPDDNIEIVSDDNSEESADNSSDSGANGTQAGTPGNLIESELDRKFGGKRNIEVVRLRDHPTVTKTVGGTRTYLIDEEPEAPVHTITPIRKQPIEANDREDSEYAGEDPSTVKNDKVRATGESFEQDNYEPAGAYSGRGRTANTGSSQSSSDNNRTESDKRSEGSETAGGANLNERSSSGATSFTTPEQLAKLREEQENKPEPPYVFPPLSLLTKGQPPQKGDSNSNELQETVDKLQRTFESFGVRVTVTDATVGPTVTRYELLPDQGVKVKTITGLSDDIKLALAAAEIRIEAPIPGKAAVGIEVPNAKTSPVLLRDLLEAGEFKDARSNLTFAVGKDIGGKTICFDIGSMPHMLIAGATGSGKSVCINALILSILYKAKPSDVKMIMIDPKRVELVGYNGVPHLLVPVVTDVKKATGALNWAIAEMDDRYERFASVGVNNLKSYNSIMEEKYYEEGNEGECPDKLPQILIIVDELNDLMMTANSKEVEAAIVRLTQLARASGIHVVLATQRPSVNVITGTIKANIPSRIAFSVSSIVDSRTIIDQAGAEKLLGKGDMLFYPQGYPKPVRLQGAYVSDKEIAAVVDFIKEKCKEVKYSDAVSKHIEKNSSGDSKGSTPGFGPANQAKESADDHDELFEQAGKFIIEKQKASIGMLQRIYKIGFNRAARIMDQLAEEGVVGPEEGTKPRRILMTLAQFDRYLAGEDIGEAGGEEAPPEE